MVARPIPVHAGETLGPGLLANVLRDCDLTRQALLELSWGERQEESVPCHSADTM
jgi:hypothetical protein